jgi:iron complex outermembrane receptor protein
MTDWNPLPQIREDYGRVTMLMSPSVVGMGQVVLRPFALRGRGSLKTTEVRLDGKYVGKQYWDNTQNDDRSIPAYFVMNLGVSHRFSIGEGSLELGAYVNNLLNRKYFSDAWGYRPYFDVEKEAGVSEGVFPQAPANVMVKVVYSFN